MTAIDTSTEAVERLLDGVTPGPWRNSKSYRGIVSDSPSGYDDAESVHAYGGHMVCESVMGHNRPFIAAARDLVPALLKERDEARAALATPCPDAVHEAAIDIAVIENGGKRWHGEDHRVVAVRWEPYKPDGQRQMKAKGRWQEQVWSGDYWRWQNCDRPAAANARADRAEAALAAQIEAVIREIWGLCEDLEDEAYAKLKLKLTEHEQGFWAAQKMTAKRIRRATQMPTNDRTALDRMLAAANARADRAEAALAAQVPVKPPCSHINRDAQGVCWDCGYDARALAASQPADPVTNAGCCQPVKVKPAPVRGVVMAEKLKPCPFCGGDDLYFPNWTDPAVIECSGCGARSGVPDDQTEVEATAKWNARVAPSLRITGPNSDGEYWLHIKAGGLAGGVNLGGEHGPICKRLFDAASETGAKE